MERCLYCRRPLPAATGDPPPDPHDDDAWLLLAFDHAPHCEWVATRAHRLFPRAVDPPEGKGGADGEGRS